MSEELHRDKLHRSSDLLGTGFRYTLVRVVCGVEIWRTFESRHFEEVTEPYRRHVSKRIADARRELDDEEPRIRGRMLPAVRR